MLIKNIKRLSNYISLSFLLMLLFSFQICFANTPVVLQLKWLHQFQFAGYYAALEKGYYADEGLDVEIKERDPNKNPIGELLKGKVQFAVSDSTVALSRLQGKPVIVLAAIFQHSPLILMSLEPSKIISPLELKHKKVMFQRSVDDAIITAMLLEFNITNDDYIHVAHNFSDDALLTGTTDVMSGYLTDQPFYYQQNNIPINVISPTNYGIDFYGDLLIVEESFFKDNPKMSLAFRRASLKGWSYALEHPEEVIKWLKTRYKVTKSIEHLRFEADMTQRMIQPNLIEIGHLNANRFKRIAKVYQQLKMTTERNDLTGLIYKEYINENKTATWLYAFIVLVMVFSVSIAIFWIINTRLKNIVKERTQELKKLCITDTLTGLPNRLQINDFYALSLAQAKRHKTQLTLIFFDIDYFKQVNDLHGHQVGDQVLQQLSQILKVRLRSSDLLGRWGGEEFLLICNHTDCEGAYILAEQCRLAVLAHKFPIDNQLSCSIGIAQWDQKESADNLFRRCDKALYQAKHNGRDRIETSLVT